MASGEMPPGVEGDRASCRGRGRRFRIICGLILFSGFAQAFLLRHSGKVDYEAQLTAFADEGFPVLESFAQASEGILQRLESAVPPGIQERIWATTTTQQHPEASSNPSTTSVERSKSASSLYAYAWVIGGIHEDRLAYKGFVYTTLIAAKVLREKGSEADFVLWAQLAPDSRLDQRLPPEDERVLQELGIQVRMLDKVAHDSFTQLVYEKFRVLTMAEYERVIFLDSDIMPRANMDYVFYLSKSQNGLPPLLRPNLNLATRGEPCNTAMFMVEPSERGWKVLEDAIERQHEEGLKLPYPHFNRATGWGWSFMDHGKPWKSINVKNGWQWNWHASHSDQGLYFYWAKYAMQDVSVIAAGELENFLPGKDGAPNMTFSGDFHLAVEQKNLTHLLPPDEPLLSTYQCDGKLAFKCKDHPYKTMVHFYGKEKPWQHGLKHHGKPHSWYLQAKAWFGHLGDLNDKYSMGLDIENWTRTHKDIAQESPFGFLATYKDHYYMIHNKSATRTKTEPTIQTNHTEAAATRIDFAETKPPPNQTKSKAPTVAYHYI